MTAIEIARRMAELNRPQEAQNAYRLAIYENKGQDPAQDMEAAVYILQSGGDYRLPYTIFQRLYNQGQFREDCLSIVTEAFYQPNIKMLRAAYAQNCKLLKQYPYLFRKDFPAFEKLPIRFYPYDDNGYTPFYVEQRRFGDYINFKRQVISRNFFKNLDNPILAADVYSQYELEYLVDNVRKSEWVGRENHIYLHYADWGTFCAHLQCLSMKPLLEDEKIVFLIGDELSQYPIDFKERFGIDYSVYPVRPIGIREVKRMIWHTQLSSHNGGDFFNEIFDGHPNLIAMPSIMMENVEKKVLELRGLMEASADMDTASLIFRAWDRRIVQELYDLKDRTDRDFFAAVYLGSRRYTKNLDRASRIVPALFFQPHFGSLAYSLSADEAGHTILSSKEYDAVANSPIFRYFKYIKTFTPMRRITTSYGATMRFMWAFPGLDDFKGKTVGDQICGKVLNRSFMIDPSDRLYMDSVLVRLEDGKLNPKATFTALAAFLDLPYTESMTYCSLQGKRNPESLKGNDIGFDPGAILRTYDEYANDAERYFIEYFMRDAYEYYGYGFKYYDGKPVDEARAMELIEQFTTSNYYIRESWRKNVLADVTVEKDGQPVPDEEQEKGKEEYLEQRLEKIRQRRINMAKSLLRNLHFVNKKGQPLQMMPLLELNPALLEQPLYH